MAENKLKLGLDQHESALDKPAFSNTVESKDSVIEGAVSEISEKVDGLAENDDNGGFQEKAKGVKDYSMGGAKTATSTSISSKALPTIENMIKQTLDAVESQLKIEEEQIKVMIKNKKASPYQMNEQVKKIRILNGILGQLKNVAKLAEDFVVSLWKQYVKKTS